LLGHEIVGRIAKIGKIEFDTIALSCNKEALIFVFHGFFGSGDRNNFFHMILKG
jgi:hypothetical protein